MEYTVLDPRGTRPSLDRVPLSPRPRSLDGKVVYCIAQDRAVFTEELARRLGQYVPGVKVVFKTKPSWIQTDASDLWNEIEMNAAVNAMGPGNRANSTIGRFLRLAINSLGGSVPGINDLSTQGAPAKYSSCFPENEEENPWEPFHVSLGYKPEESVVSLLSGGWGYWSFSGDIDHIARAVAGFFGSSQALVILAPGAARLYARKGMSKDDVEKYIWEHAVTQLPDFSSKWALMAIPGRTLPVTGAPRF